jgi:hypothetical protein
MTLCGDETARKQAEHRGVLLLLLLLLLLLSTSQNAREAFFPRLTSLCSAT